MFGFRECEPCSELKRTPEEILAYDALPYALRPRRAATHTPAVVDDYVGRVANYVRFFGVPRAQLPWAPEDQVAFFEAMEDQMPLSELVAHATAFNSYHISNGFEPPRSVELRVLLRRLRKAQRKARQKATPFTIEQVRAMADVAALRKDLIGSRDRALILNHVASAMRPEEFGAIRWVDIDGLEGRGAIRIRIPQSKGDQAGYGQSVTIVARPRNPHCPVHALREWRKENHGKYVFCRLTSNYEVGEHQLINTEINRIIQAYADVLRIPGKISGYSSRRGCATIASNNGASLEAIRRHLRHKRRETTQGYIDELPLPEHLCITAVVMG
jgi:integrase